jgi:hypothetical protein
VPDLFSGDRFVTAFDEIMALRDNAFPTRNEVDITGTDPVLETYFRIAETAAAVLAGIGVAVTDLWEMKTGCRQKIAVDVRSAAATLRSNKYLQIRNPNGVFEYIFDPEHEANRELTDCYLAKDGRWVLPHFGLGHLRQRMLDLLGAEPNANSIARAVAKWDAIDLEAAIDEQRVCGGMIRSNEEWLAEEHGQVLAAKPVVEVIKIGDSEPEPMPVGERPLSGIRVLDLTRILAGPITARTLAEHGAEVLMVAGEHVPQVLPYVADTSHGKRSCFLDLRQSAEVEKLRGLVRSADIFSQGYRPNMIGRLGFGPEELAALRPGLVYVSISCYGADGPFSHRAGWEQVAQIMSGIAAEGVQTGPAYRPRLLPAAANDYITGYLGAYGALLALARRAHEGGSYHVRVSLCQTAMMIYRQGKITTLPQAPDLSADEIDALRIESNCHLGRIRHLGPVLRLSETMPGWNFPTPKLGGDAAMWRA